MHPEHAAFPRSAAERAVPWVAAAVVALPVLWHRYPAMIDLPCHEEIVAAMRHFGDPARYPPGLMRWNLGHPNQLFYFLAFALALVAPVDLACKLVVAASVAAVPLGAARLADFLGVSRWVALAVAPLGLGFFFYFGFVGNLLAFGMLLGCLPVLDRLARAPTAGSAALSTLVLLGLYFAHDSALAIGALAVVVLSLGQPLLRPSTLWKAAPLVLAGGVALTEQIYAMRHLGSNLRAVPELIDLGFDQRWDNVAQALMGLHGSTATRPAFFAMAAVIVLYAVERVLEGRAGLRGPAIKVRLDEHRFLVLGVALVVAYFEVPFAYAGAMWLHARFLAPGIAVLAVALAPRRPVVPSVATRVASAVALALVIALLRPELAATARVYAELDPLLSKIEPGSAIAPLDLLGGPGRDLGLTVPGVAARAAAERGGRMAASFTQASPIPAVVVAPEHRWEDSFFRLSRDSLSLEPARDLHLFRYVLAWTLPGQSDPLERALAPEAQLVGRSGGWLLFESTLPLVALLAPEPAGAVVSETVRERLEGAGRQRP